MSGYLFVHFTGEDRDGEQVYFSLSRDGLHWTDLNGGKPVLFSHIGEKGIRDPFPVRDQRNNKFYLIATDLRIEAGKGWEAAQYRGSRNLIVWESQDLCHWSRERACPVGIKEAGCVWAPEAIWDEQKEAFLVFWASMVKLPGEKEPKQRIYGSHTADFMYFTKPEIYIEKENHVIDTTIIGGEDGYYRFSKDETTKRIVMDYCTTLDGADFRPVSSEVLDNLYGVEGPECYRLPDGKWCLIVDRFAEGKGYLPIIIEDLKTGKMRIPGEDGFDLGFSKKRHGGVLALTDEEYERLSGI